MKRSTIRGPKGCRTVTYCTVPYPHEPHGRVCKIASLIGRLQFRHGVVLSGGPGDTGPLVISRSVALIGLCVTGVVLALLCVTMATKDLLVLPGVPGSSVTGAACVWFGVLTVSCTLLGVSCCDALLLTRVPCAVLGASCCA